MTRENLYKFLAELDNEIADYSDGCMGNNYTPEREKEAVEKGTLFKDGSRGTPGHYLLDTIRKYINIGNIV